MVRILRASLVLLALVAGVARADVISLLGDKDCFGIPSVTSCPDGSLFVTDLGGVFFTDYRTVGDPPFTDIWSDPGGVSYTDSYSVPVGALSATLQLLIAGIHDINTSTVYTVFFDGVAIGAIAPNFDPNAYQQVLTYSFTVPVALLTGNDTVSWSNTGGDGYIIDYSQLTIHTTTVPEPSSLLLLGLGAAALGLVRRRRRG